MNPTRLVLLPALALCLLAPTRSVRAADPAGYIDLGALTPSVARDRLVEVRLDANVIGLVTKLAGNIEPEVSQLLKGLRQIQVNVVGLDDSNRSIVTDQLTAIRSRLDGDGWQRVVSVREPDQDVAVHLRARGQEAIEGVTVTVRNGTDEAVLVNVVGDIRPEQLAELGERFDIEPLRRVGEAVRKESRTGSGSDAAK